MAPKQRYAKNNQLARGVKSKRGQHLLALQKNRAALLQMSEEVVQVSISSSRPITSTPNNNTLRIQDSATEIEHSNITPLSTTAMVNEDSLVEIGSSKTDSLLDLGYFTYSGGEDQELSSNKDTAENTISQSTHMPSDIEQSPEFSRDGETEENGTAQSINASPDVIKDSDPNLMKGCRIIDVMFYEEQMVQMNDHNSPFNCNFSHMQLINEIRYGLSFVRTFKCGMCGITNKLYSHRYLESTKKKDDESVEMNINEAAVAGTLIAGIGETALNHVLSALNIPTMSSRTFSKYREKVAINLENVAKDTMYKSAMKARAIAISKGREDKFGNALVPVIVDGAYCQRSYRTTYSSLGGCGVIIAAETGEVLYVGVKNKFCVICTKAKNKGVEPKKHTCHQNWGENRSSASMEAAAIVEGFLQSESMYKIRYYKMIADGDSSVYKSILDAHPYENLIVQKIECRNHLMRNFCSNITADCLTSSERNKEKCALKSYVLQKLPKLRIGIRKSIDHWSAQGITPQTIKGLERDLLNAASHVFGEHAKCAEIGYFCDGKPKPDEKNMVPSLKKHNIYQSVMERCDRLVNHSKSLLHNVTNNAVESFNAIIASKISGKRVNFTARDSYKAHIHCAVLTSVGEPFRLLHKKSTKLSPGLYSKLIEKRTLQKRIGQRGHKKVKKQLFNKTPNDSADYGLAAAAPDLEPDVFQSSLLRKIEQIKENHKDIVQIELDTRGQSDSSLWYEIRRNLITASNVGSICKLKSTTSTAGTVNKILYSWFDNDNVKWGRDHEKVAIAAVEEHFELEIVPCGLFIHQNHYYIGASPDGLIGDDGIIEVKCPSKARDLSVTEGVAKGFIDCLDKETLELKKTSNYYYQVQAQMEVTNRSFCIFTVWTSVNWVVQSIPRDETFWNQKMPKLENFYFKSLLPELVDSRKRRSLPLRAINIEGIDIDKLPPIEKKKKPTASKKMKKEKPAQKKMKNEKPGLKKTKKETPALRESKRKLAPKKGIKEEPARPKIKKEKTPSVTVSTPLETATSKKNLKRKGTTSILPPIEKEKKQARTIKKRKTSCTKNLTPSSETSATSSGIDILFNSTCLKISSKPMIIQPKANQ